MPDASAVEVYGFWRSQATFRVRVALNLKGIAYHEVPVNLDGGEQNRDTFRGVNPLGSVPSVMIGKTPLTQSLAILEYLEETHPEPPLLPSDALGRARVRALAAIAVADTHPLIVPRIKRYLAEVAAFDAAQWKAWQGTWFEAGLRGYEARLAGEGATGVFCHGDDVTFADICLVGLAAGATTFGVEVADIPTVERIAGHCKTLPAFIAAEASRQVDYPG